jgi:hypothetical protein
MLTLPRTYLRTKTKQRKRERENSKEGQSGLTGSSPLAWLEAKSFETC